MKSRVLRCVLVGACLVAVVLSPYVAFATSVSEAQTTNRYSGLAKKIMLLQAADYCVGHISNVSTSALTSADLSSDTSADARKKILNLFKLNFTYGDNSVYSSYLEATAENPVDWLFDKYKSDGKVYCSELGNILVKTFENFDSYNNKNMESVICDNSLFAVYMGYASLGSYGTANVKSVLKHGGEYSWPSGWVEPSGDSSLLDSSTCHANFDNIWSALSGVDAYPKKKNKNFQIAIKRVNGFVPSQYLSSKVGDTGSVNGQLLYATQLLNFQQVCPTTALSKKDYDSKVSQGIDNIYSIYDGNTATIQYVQMTSEVVKKTVYASGNVTSSASTTCGDIARALSPTSSSASEMIDHERETEVANCYNTAQDNISEIKKIQTYVESIYTLASSLLSQARDFETDTDTHASGRFLVDFSESMRDIADKVGGGSAFDDLIQITDEFENSLRTYDDKIGGGTKLSDSEKENLTAEIDNYESDLEIFKTNVVDKITEVVDSIPDIDKDSMYIYGPVAEGQSGINDKVDNFYEFDEDGNLICTVVASVLPEIASKIEDITGSDIPLAGYTPLDRDKPEDQDPNAPAPTCENSGGAESLGWIVCPVLDWMTRASGQLYNNYIVPALQVKPKLFEERTGDGNDTFDVWGIFQGFANVLFIILLLAVIFSQLTGVGIDNYGIKKILPKLLVAAILVNLSYYICVALVDVSNIVGNSLQAMFDGMASGLSAPLPGGGGSGAGATAITAVLILGGLAAVGVAIWQNPAILLTLLVAALGVVISILFLFVILSAREAAIVVLTVISPLAFACYMLPNTKKLFDKWLKIWEGLLLVYPICGLLVGGGNFMSKLMLSATGAGTDGSGFFGSFTAMLIGIVPIFFIPTVLKGSFAAMGNLGAKISGFGDRMRGGVTRGIRNSEGFRNAQKLGLERRTRKKAGLDKNGNLTKSGERRANLAQTRFGRLIGADKRRAAYINAAKRDVATGEEANASLTNALSRSAIAANGGNAEAYYTDQFEQAASSGNIRGMNAALAAAVSSGYLKDKDIAKIVRNAQNAGKINIKDAATRAAWMRDAATKYGNGFLATDFEMRHWMQNGGSNTLGDFGAYAASVKANGDPMIGVDDIKPEDIPRLSGDSLAGLAQAGILTASMAQQVMAKNPNISADKRIMLGAIASGAANDASIVAASVAAGNIGASVLKEEAKALMLNPSATTWTDKNGATHTISAIRITDDTAAQVNSWTAPTPVAANVVQDFSSGYSGQIEPVDVQIRGATNTAGVVAPAAPSSTGSSSGIILDSSGEQARQAMREFDARERARGNRNWPGNSNS